MSSKPSVPAHPTMGTPQPENPVALSAVTPTVTTTTSTTTTTPGSTPSLPPQPQFAFDDINTTSLAGLAPHITINEQVRKSNTSRILAYICINKMFLVGTAQDYQKTNEAASLTLCIEELEGLVVEHQTPKQGFFKVNQ